MLRVLVLGGVWAVASCAGAQGGEVAQGPRSQAAAVGVEDVRADGACAARLGLTLRLGGLRLPLALDARTEAGSEGRTRGEVGVDVAGVVAARCAVEGGEAACEAGGLLSR